MVGFLLVCFVGCFVCCGWFVCGFVVDCLWVVLGGGLLFDLLFLWLLIACGVIFYYAGLGVCLVCYLVVSYVVFGLVWVVVFGVCLGFVRCGFCNGLIRFIVITRCLGWWVFVGCGL